MQNYGACVIRTLQFCVLESVVQIFAILRTECIFTVGHLAILLVPQHLIHSGVAVLFHLVAKFIVDEVFRACGINDSHFRLKSAYTLRRRSVKYEESHRWDLET